MFRNPQVTFNSSKAPVQVAAIIGEVHGSSHHRLAPPAGCPRGRRRPPGYCQPRHHHQPSRCRQPIVVDLGTDPLHSGLANIPIFAGDTIIIGRIGVVYMMGDFKNPGVIPLTQYAPLTLMEATAMSGGLAFQGKYDDVRLIRTVGDHRTLVKLDIQRILHGKDADPVLQANDIVFLPDSALKASMINGSLGTLLGIVSLLLAVAHV